MINIQRLIKCIRTKHGSRCALQYLNGAQNYVEILVLLQANIRASFACKVKTMLQLKIGVFLEAHVSEMEPSCSYSPNTTQCPYTWCRFSQHGIDKVPGARFYFRQSS